LVCFSKLDPRFWPGGHEGALCLVADLSVEGGTEDPAHPGLGGAFAYTWTQSTDETSQAVLARLTADEVSALEGLTRPP
jgi:hypothetical protein